MQAETLRIDDSGTVTIPARFLESFRGREITVMKTDEDDIVYLSSTDAKTIAERERERHNAAYTAKLDEAERQIENGQTVTYTMAELRAME